MIWSLVEMKREMLGDMCSRQGLLNPNPHQNPTHLLYRKKGDLPKKTIALIERIPKGQDLGHIEEKRGDPEGRGPDLKKGEEKDVKSIEERTKVGSIKTGEDKEIEANKGEEKEVSPDPEAIEIVTTEGIPEIIKGSHIKRRNIHIQGGIGQGRDLMIGLGEIDIKEDDSHLIFYKINLSVY